MAERGSSVSSSSSNQDFNSPIPSGILEGVVAYVEVRTASDNRSAAVKRVLERMGARVEDKFSDNVTHVIFKEGKKRTRDKALRLGLHLVSVLWVDSCKEKQQRVPEADFTANTDKCGTPPPGVRWKKYKSMQPRDFADDLARSAERCQKRQKKKGLCQQLLGSNAITPFHAPSHVFVVDTQLRSPHFVGQDLMTPLIIPCTPLSMQARLDQLARSKEAEKLEEAEESPCCSNTGQDVPLSRKLFRSQTSTPGSDTNNKPRRRSSRLSGYASASVHDRASQDQKISYRINDTRVTADSQSTADVEPSSSNCSKRERHRRQSNPDTVLSQNEQPAVEVRQTRRSIRQSFPCNLPQLDKQGLKSEHQGDGGISRSRDNISIQPQTSAHAHRKRKPHRIESSSSDDNDDEIPVSVRQQERKCRGTSNRLDRKGGEATDVDIAHSLAQENHNPGQMSQSAVIQEDKSKSRKRRLLNPSQEMHVLSPSPTDNPNIPKAASQGEEAVRRGRKRKSRSCDVDTVFPSSFPVPRAGYKMPRCEENQRKRVSATQTDTKSSEQSVNKSRAGNRKKNVAKNKSAVDQSRNGSGLSSTSQLSSVLGSSMSMMFNNTSMASSVCNRFLPPRGSISEFQVKKTGGRKKPTAAAAALGRACSGQNEQDPRLTSRQKFQLSCMPSLVMTSLHYQEQDVVIAAVKCLGVFRVEDRVSKDTTHVVSGEPRRTLNLLHGMARGCWILSKEWVLRSVEQGHWLGEEDYEIVQHIPAVKEARLAREAVPPGAYQCSMFETVGSFFVSRICTPPRAQFVKLLQLCGAKVTESIHRADFYLGDHSHEEKNSIKPVWALDCIIQQRLLPMEGYVLAINHKAKSSSSPEY